MESPVSASPITIPRALLVLNDPSEARRLASFLDQHGLEVVHVKDEAGGYNLLDTEQVDALISDIRAPHIDGLRLLRVARLRNPDVCVVLFATQADLNLATRAMEEGAHDFQTRPLNQEKILSVIKRGLAVQRMVGEMHEMARRLDRKFGFNNLIGNSAQIIRVHNRILQVCGTDVPVLITGESGTGRELVAAAIHHNSARRLGPLVRLDCAGAESGYLERELVGEEQGEHPKARPGRFELAEGGTLVLDSIEELPRPAQARLLRVLRSREYERVGGASFHYADVRLIAVSSEDLRARVDSGTFHGELYDHLRAVTIEMPALRHRRRDIPTLVNHFLSEGTRQTGHQVDGIKPAALDRLVRYSWPGNVRELKNVILAMIEAFPGPGRIDVGNLPEEIRESTTSGDAEIRIPLGVSLSEVERRLIEATLAHTGGNREEAARILGIGLRTLQRRLVQYRVAWPGRSR